ncbi:MAG: VCBS repeat-containing protein [Verrucomicrobia bacterium]|nr:VCBS repeat-containing protein [Verrucomicrobiota bacterium]
MASSLTGVDFANELKEATHLNNQITLNGSGVAAGDYDKDGLCDLYFCGLDSGNRLYRNTGGFRFEDVTEKAGVQCANRLSTGAVFVDFNADFFPDLLVNSIGQGTLVFVNNRDGTFSEVTNGIGFNRGNAGMSFAIADMDGDQYLDFTSPTTGPRH